MALSSKGYEVSKLQDAYRITREVLDDTFGKNAYANEHLERQLIRVYLKVKVRARKNKLTQDEMEKIALREVSNTIWYAYSGGNTCYRAGERIINGWRKAGVIF